jgi:hypothetical protein
MTALPFQVGSHVRLVGGEESGRCGTVIVPPNPKLSEVRVLELHRAPGAPEDLAREVRWVNVTELEAVKEEAHAG